MRQRTPSSAGNRRGASRTCRSARTPHIPKSKHHETREAPHRYIKNARGRTPGAPARDDRRECEATDTPMCRGHSCASMRSRYLHTLRSAAQHFSLPQSTSTVVANVAKQPRTFADDSPFSDAHRHAALSHATTRACNTAPRQRPGSPPAFGRRDDG